MILVTYVNYRKEYTAIKLNEIEKAERHGLISRWLILAAFTWCTELIYAYSLYSMVGHLAIWKSNFTQNRAWERIYYRPKVENRLSSKKYISTIWKLGFFTPCLCKQMCSYVFHVRKVMLVIVCVCTCVCEWERET